MIECLKKYDQYYNQNKSDGDQTSSNVFKLTDRGTNLIISAPHATRSFTNKHVKIADLFTGALAQYIGETENISTLIRVKYTPYKCLISDYVVEQNLQNHCFLDLHGFNQDINYDICLGIHTYEKKGYPHLDKIISIAKKYHLKYIINHPNYTGRFGLVGRYQEKFGQPNVIQLELKKYLRDFYLSPDIVKNITIPFMKEVIKSYKNQ